jgi:23S rRNA pseudouridine2604 synthase
MSNPNDGIRLNKFISESGMCSRRDADRMIESGKVKVNGKQAIMGCRVTDADQVVVNGRQLTAKPKAVYLAYHKPAGIICTTDQTIAGNIVDAINYGTRIFPIGRLDKESTGLILLTNDGDIVNKILRAGNLHEKEYSVEVDHPINKSFIRKMATGVPVLDTITLPCKVRQLSANRFNIVLTQGLNRQIRRMAEFLGYQVTHLQRLRIMNIRLASLQAGHWRARSEVEIAAINQLLATSSKTEEASRLANTATRKQRNTASQQVPNSPLKKTNVKRFNRRGNKRQ